MKQAYFEVGQIVNTFGIKGFLKVKPFTDDLRRFEELENVLVEKNKELLEMKIEDVKYQNSIILLKLKEINDINTAEKFKGCYIKIERENAKKLPKNTYFIADLIGLDVYTDKGELLGKITDIYDNKSSDIYVVKDNFGKQILLPGIKDVIKQIDIEEEKIIVHLLKGLV